MKLYSALLLQNTPWALLVPTYSLEHFPRKLPFGIDTQFGQMSRPPVSLLMAHQRHTSASSSVLGARNVVVSSGGRELSLSGADAMLSSSISAATLWDIGSGKANPVIAATYQRALGTLKAVVGTQWGATLVRRSQIAMSQRASLPVFVQAGATQPQSQAPFKSLIAELGESSSSLEPLNAQLWSGWQIAGQTDLSVQTKRLQGALLGRLNRILDKSDDIPNDAVVMWDTVSDSWDTVSDSWDTVLRPLE